MAKLTSSRAPLGVSLAVALLAAVAGCATAPSGGPPRAAPGGSNQVQAYVQPLPGPGPNSSWNAPEVVMGFLHASASYAFDPAAARQYLGPALRKDWHPGRGPVEVVGAITPPKEHLLHDVSLEASFDQVEFTGQHLATLSQSGQYQYTPSESVPYQFVLGRTKGVWLIDQLPSQQSLLLMESDFEQVYQPRNLFFYAPGSSSVLVPDPIYAPLQSSNSALNTDLATGLVNGLLKGQGGDWLSGATTSAFPPGTRLLKRVTITGKTAQVDLGGAAARADGPRVTLMAVQLAETLGDGSYSRPLATHVQLSINNTPPITVSAPNYIPPVPSGPIQLITGTTSAVSQLPSHPGSHAKSQARPDQPQIGQATVTALAAAPGPEHSQQTAVAIEPVGGGCTVQEQPTDQAAYTTYQLTSSGPACSSLSYDPDGNLWAAAGRGVWVLYPGHAPMAIDLSAMTAAIQPADQILALRMAPDAVRAAVLVSTPTGNQLLLAAVHVRAGSAAFGEPVTVGTTGLADPVAISWYDGYHLAVLATQGIYEVPLTSGAAQQPAPQLISTAPPGATTLTSDGTELVVGTGQSVYDEAVSSPGWSFVTNGLYPAYPG